jgi:hypothetical protein
MIEIYLDPNKDAFLGEEGGGEVQANHISDARRLLSEIPKRRPEDIEKAQVNNLVNWRTPLAPGTLWRSGQLHLMACVHRTVFVSADSGVLLPNGNWEQKRHHDGTAEISGHGWTIDGACSGNVGCFGSVCYAKANAEGAEYAEANREIGIQVKQATPQHSCRLLTHVRVVATCRPEYSDEFERSWLMLGDLYIHSGKYDLAQVSPRHDGLVGCFLIALSLRPPGSMQKVLDT